MEETDFSENFRPIKADYETHQDFTDPELLYVTSGARLYRARKAGKFFMLKTPKEDSGLYLDLLKREYELSIGFSHPHIIQVYTYEPQTVVGPCIVMEYVDGRNLADYLLEHPSWDARIRIFGQLLEAVSCLHKADVIHNDLKPQNILITRTNDDVKLIDFGLSDNSTHFLLRKLGGTPRYAAPELLEEQGETDASSDIYSIGCLMNDLFGNRYTSIRKRCLYTDRSRRYANVEALQQAWHRRTLPRRISAVLLLLLLITLPTGLYIQERLHRMETIRTTQLKNSYYDSVTTALKQEVAHTRQQIVDTVQQITSAGKEQWQKREKQEYDRQASLRRITTDFDTRMAAEYIQLKNRLEQIPYREFALTEIYAFISWSWTWGKTCMAQTNNAAVRTQIATHIDERRNQLQEELYDSAETKTSITAEEVSPQAQKFYQELLKTNQPYRPYSE